MNRKGNLLNGALLGSSGSSTKIFIQAAQWCEAQTAAILKAGRKLKHSTGINGAVVTTVLRAGRKLKAVSQSGMTTSAKLFGWVAVPLTPVTVPLSVTTTATLKAMHAVPLSTGSAPLSVNTSVVLKCMHPVLLNAVNTSLLVQTSAVVQQMHAVYLTSLNTQGLVNTSGTLSKGSRMKINSTCQSFITVVLSESSKIRAPLMRTSLLSKSQRISVIPGI